MAVSDGKAGSSCTVAENADKTKTIKCTDGTAVTLSDGATGTTGVAGQPGAKGDPGKSADDAPAGYLAADGIKGGAAYSEWFGASGAGKGDLAKYSVTNGAEFARCKTCHGWDGLGNAGSYANRTGISTGEATRADVSGVNLRVTTALTSHQDLYDLIAAPWGRPMNAANDSRHPDFSKYLSEAQIWNLVKFMREEWVSPNELYDLQVVGAPMHYEMVAGVSTLIKPKLTVTNIGKDGDAVAGKATYTAKCAACHDADGKKVLLEKGTMTLGQFVRGKANEAWFKIKFGQGAVMVPGLITSTQDLKNLYKAFADTATFPDK